MGYVAGSSPNRWGLSRDGSSVSDLFSESAESDKQQKHRTHSLFAPVVLLMLKEVNKVRGVLSMSWITNDVYNVDVIHIGR